jgi:hypothetical protein
MSEISVLLKPSVGIEPNTLPNNIPGSGLRKSMADPATDHGLNSNYLPLPTPSALIPTPLSLPLLGQNSPTANHTHYDNLVKGFTTVTIAVCFLQ